MADAEAITFRSEQRRGCGHRLRDRHQGRAVPAQGPDGDHRVGAGPGHGDPPHRRRDRAPGASRWSRSPGRPGPDPFTWEEDLGVPGLDGRNPGRSGGQADPQSDLAAQPATTCAGASNNASPGSGYCSGQGVPGSLVGDLFNAARRPDCPMIPAYEPRPPRAGPLRARPKP